MGFYTKNNLIPVVNFTMVLGRKYGKEVLDAIARTDLSMPDFTKTKVLIQPLRNYTCVFIQDPFKTLNEIEQAINAFIDAAASLGQRMRRGTVNIINQPINDFNRQMVADATRGKPEYQEAYEMAMGNESVEIPTQNALWALKKATGVFGVRLTTPSIEQAVSEAPVAEQEITPEAPVAKAKSRATKAPKTAIAA